MDRNGKKIHQPSARPFHQIQKVFGSLTIWPSFRPLCLSFAFIPSIRKTINIDLIMLEVCGGVCVGDVQPFGQRQDVASTRKIPNPIYFAFNPYNRKIGKLIILLIFFVFIQLLDNPL